MLTIYPEAKEKIPGTSANIMQSSSSICDVSTEAPGCVRLNSYFFNTTPAQKDNERTPAFAAGGSYNQIESRCSLLDTKGNALLIESGDSLSNALKNLVHSCEEEKVSPRRFKDRIVQA